MNDDNENSKSELSEIVDIPFYEESEVWKMKISAPSRSVWHEKELKKLWLSMQRPLLPVVAV